MGGQSGRLNVGRTEPEEESGDEGEVDATGIEEKDIELVCLSSLLVRQSLFELVHIY